MSRLKLKYKIWLENNGKAFGDGPLDILKRVERSGSLKQAASEMNMSYSHAWNLIKGLEKRLGFKLIRSRVGGVKGGCSELTDEARLLVAKYESFRNRVDEVLADLYQTIFSE
ncbi:winged helix-turn-helix domain-containing protein [Thermosediminibacter litoriperuensis]|uniref:Molybdate transport system regulatory protein n=1 Tax=Thermosediminibacter litoriperuensis TaxID=291989 RepID=A0A5S5AKH6_9FIRM|nr:LysR family transcriptional regulator [Thermosediminibacter litoriperuensis]TYP51587.1 molybdate transport system regulatory protein [Thermosediminibacter litoriperuensis]